MFQEIYDFFRGIKTPLWLKVFLSELQTILLAALMDLGKGYLLKLENKVIEVAGSNMSNRDKFNAVFDYGKIQFPDIKDSLLNLLIETLVSKLKATDFVRIS